MHRFVVLKTDRHGELVPVAHTRGAPEPSDATSDAVV